jgi:hypothetical protein
MNRAQFKKVLAMAVNKDFEPIPYLSEEMGITFGGCALDRKRRFCTTRQFASMICGHCFTFAGTWDFSELPELEEISKRFDLADI